MQLYLRNLNQGETINLHLPPSLEGNQGYDSSERNMISRHSHSRQYQRRAQYEICPEVGFFLVRSDEYQPGPEAHWRTMLAFKVNSVDGDTVENTRKETQLRASSSGFFERKLYTRSSSVVVRFDSSLTPS